LQAFSESRSVADRIADVMVDRATRGCTLNDLLDEGFTQDEITAHGAEAEAHARKRFMRQSCDDATEAATDDLAREEVEHTRRTILVSIPAAELCQIWQGLRAGSSCSPIEATLRLTQAYGGEVAP
jgi:hypothetical protein